LDHLNQDFHKQAVNEKPVLWSITTATGFTGSREALEALEALELERIG
jgi:hypothetical protein